MKTKLVAAFCGTGKTTAIKNKINAVEIEYWKYKKIPSRKKYIKEVKNLIGTVDHIFLSTDPEGLKLLKEEGFNITLVYPENELRCEYLNRFIERDSPYDFIGAYMKYWDNWLDELKEQNYCNHIVLESGQYLQDVL